MNEQINITKADGTSVNAYIICFIENKSTGKRYVYYTLNETSGEGANGTVKIYVSKINQNNPALDTPISEEEWGTLKGYMSDALKGNLNPDVKYLPLTDLGTPTSISEKAIAMPTSYDYVNKQRGIYAQNVAVSEPTPEPTTEASTEPAAPTTPETPASPVEGTPESSEPAAPTAPEPVVEPTLEPTPIVPETPETPIAPEPVPAQDPITTPESAPTPEVTPVTPPVGEPLVEPNDDTTSGNGNASILTPINLDEIEQKYAEMIETINKLKSQELEAAKRYNATIELSAMHNEQHANYVQNEQNKELAAAPIQEPTASVEPAPTPVIEPIATVEPEPTPAPAAPITEENLETNWFDMPAS